MKTDLRPAVLILMSLPLLHPAPVAAQKAPAPSLETPTVEVVADTPLPGVGVPRSQIPAAVHAVGGEALRQSGSANLPDFLERALPGVSVNQTQGNPLQADVNYRGFTASPRLGIPQGLSVYLDGVRINEPFGDVVNWALVPEGAIAAINLLPGSNPLFGLNTLGGALSIRSKSGENFPGTALEATLGSFGRRKLEAEHGGSRDELGWYVSGSAFSEDGWRDFTPGRQTNLFAKVGRQGSDYDLDLSLLLADARLIGNQVTPNHLLRERRQSIYTHPDISEHGSAMLNLTASRWLSADRLLAGNVYYRRVNGRDYNVDLNEVDDPRFGVVPFEGGPNDLDAAGTGLNVRSMAINRNRTALSAFGFTGQLSRVGETDRLTIGTSYDHGRTAYSQSYQLGSFTADRGGVAGAGEIEQESVNLFGRTATWSLFATATAEIGRDTQLTASGRYNHTRVRTDERIGVPYPPPALGLANDFGYTRFNPALGLTWNPAGRLAAYAGVNQGSRAPSPIELGCADPNSPCLLSNAVASDPYLAQVVARTIEAGLRGTLGSIRWQAGVWRTDLRDDILFVYASGSRGYFKNFGRTRRQGLELALSGEAGRISWFANYALVDATYRSPEVVLGEANSGREDIDGDGDDDEIRIAPGNRIPGIPRHQLKAGVRWKLEQVSVGATASAFSWQYARGNENNQHRPGSNAAGDTFLGSGRAPGYVIVNLMASVRPARDWELTARIDNLFDRRYATAAVLGESAFPTGAFSPDSGTWLKDTFFAPGAPRALWITLRHGG